MRAAILLAAGSSRRFGRAANKLLVRHAGATMLAHSLAVARTAPVARIIVVTGADRVRVARSARGPRTTIVHARNHARGLAASLAAGVAALRPCERAAFIFLADMPWVPAGLAGRLARALKPASVAARPFAQKRGGHPVLIRRSLLDRALALRGDIGLAALLKQLPRGEVATVRADRRCLADADTRSSLSRRVPALR